MPFSKSFPRTAKDKTYPQWEEVFLTEAEETEVEEKARSENVVLLKRCIIDAKKVMEEENLKDYQTDLVHLAIALFEKRASHEVYWKENKAKQKFDEAH